MSRADRILDILEPFNDPTESWQEKEWGTLYCMTCGSETERVENIGFGAAWYRCPDCQHEPVPDLKPGFDFVWFAVVLLFVGGFAALFLGPVAGLFAGGGAVWILATRSEFFLKQIVGR